MNVIPQQAPTSTEVAPGEPAPPRVASRIARAARATAGRAATLASAAWPGVALGSIAAVLLLVGAIGSEASTGLGVPLDVGVFVLLGAVGLGLSALLVSGLRALLTAGPARFWTGTLSGVVFFAIFGLVSGGRGFVLLLLALPLMALAAALGAGLSVLVRARSRGLARGYAWAGALVVVLGLVATGALATWLAARGDDPNLATQHAAARLDVTPLAAENPATPGPYAVKSLTYGSGDDRRRPEFAAAVAWKTDPVDASKLLPDFKGLKARLRAWYWGFGKDRFPLDGRVWYPDGAGPFPLVLMVHGNHKAQAFSDPGYAYLGELLASRGIIAVSVDENFLNGSWEGGIDEETGVRGWMLLEHLAAWRRWNGQEGHPFEGKVDLANIGLIGHSRGGEAVAVAAAFNRLRHYPDDATVPFDFGFSIRSVAAIAPADGRYEPAGLRAPIENVSYFVIQGSHDSDVSWFVGNRPYQRAKFTDGRYHFKAALYVHRANHGQFNTTWGDNDTGSFIGSLLNRGALLSGDDQRRVAKTYLAGFMEATLHGRDEYVPMFRDYRTVARWLPETIYFNRFEDSRYHLVSSFEDTIDVSRTTLPGGTQEGENLTVWKQGDVKGRGDRTLRNQAVWLGWDRGESDDPAKVATYTIALPAGLSREWALDDGARLVFSLADTDESPRPAGESAKKSEDGAKKPDGAKDPVDLTLELVDRSGATARLALSAVTPLQPVVKVRFSKWDLLETLAFEKAWEPVFQTYEIPLSAFERDPAWSARDLAQIRWRFDRTPRDVVLLDEVGIAP